MNNIIRCLCLFVGGCMLISCGSDSKNINETVATEIDTINFERDWKDADVVEIIQDFPAYLFTKFERREYQIFQSYDYYKYNAVDKFLNSDILYANFLLTGIWSQDVFFSVYKDNYGVCYFEMKLDNSCVDCKSDIPFFYRKEINDSVFNDLFRLLEDVKFWDMDIEYIDRGISDGTTWFIDVRDSTRHKYVKCNTPELKIYNGEKREHYDALVKIDSIGSYFLTLSDFRDRLGLCKDVGNCR